MTAPDNRSSITRRRVLGGMVSSGVGAVAASSPVAAAPSSDRIPSAIGEMLMLGFTGMTVDSASANNLADHIAAGRVGSVCFVKGNVGSRDDVVRLVRKFSPEKSSVLVAIDHEGGIVQRLTARHGFTTLPPAYQVAASLSPDQAYELYSKAGGELADVGFNLNLAPVVDIHDPANPQIGHYGRSFNTDPATITTYAESCIDGFASAGVRCAIKHFPGQGLAHNDSHIELPDITATWSANDLVPYTRLIASGRARAILGGHVLLRNIEKEAIPTTLSPAVTTGLLRGKLGFKGVAITDDLDMTAVGNLMGRRAAVVRAIAAGNDILMIRNDINFDPELPQNVVKWVREAIAEGILQEKRILASADRVRMFKQKPSGVVLHPI